MDKFFSTFQVAKMCHVSPATVSRWIHNGDLRSATTVGGHKRVMAQDVLRLLKLLDMPIPPDLSLLRLRSSLKVLVVEDDQQLRQALKKFFSQKFSSAEVIEAGEGFEAGWLAREHCPDLILLDLRLPGMDGFEFCRFIRSLPKLNHTKIIAMTGFGAKGKKEILDLGADEFMTKPFEWDDLERAIREHIVVSDFHNAGSRESRREAS